VLVAGTAARGTPSARGGICDYPLVPAGAACGGWARMDDDVRRRLIELPKNVLASGVAWSWGAMAFNNLDVLRVRWQVTPGAVALHEGSVRSFAAQIIAKEGFLRGLCLPGVSANVAFCTFNGAVRVGTYPVIRDAITPFVGGAADAPQTMLAAGLLSGAVGYFIPTPFQLLKVRLQGIDAGLVDSATGRLTTGARAGEVRLYGTLRHGLQRVYANEGLRGLWRGGSALTFRGSLHRCETNKPRDFNTGVKVR
jgi:hypothetical protein